MFKLFIRIFNFLFINQIRIQEELLMCQIFRDTIEGSSWLINKNFTCRRAAANYTFLYILYRILNEVKPLSILELGIGETTKLTSQYIINNDHSAKLTLVESDKFWIDRVNTYFPPNENIEVLNLNVHEFVYKNKKTSSYDKLIENVNDKKFDLIIVDGPRGEGKRFARIGFIDLVLGNIKDDFIIIIDDYDRQGEKDSVKELINRLNNLNIDHDRAIFRGINDQYVLFSKNLSFIKNW